MYGSPVQINTKPLNLGPMHTQHMCTQTVPLFFHIVSNFNTLKTQTLLVHAGLCCVFIIHQTLSLAWATESLMSMWSFTMCYLLAITSSEGFWVCTEFYSGEISGWAQSQTCNGHPSTWWSCSIFFFFFMWCLVSSDVGWHIRDKLRPMREHGSV